MANETNPIIASPARAAKTALRTRGGRWDNDDDGAGAEHFKALSREEATALRLEDPPLNPWRVIGVQVGVGGVVALLAALAAGSLEVGWSALYGAACVVVPGALMARGMTSRLSSLSPMVSALSVMWYSTVKIGVSVAMLMLAARLVQPLSWPALLVGLVAGMSVYWFALLWRGRRQIDAKRMTRA